MSTRKPALPPASRRSGVEFILRLLGRGEVADCFNDLERTLDRIDPFWAECALSLRSAQAYGAHPSAPSGQAALDEWFSQLTPAEAEKARKEQAFLDRRLSQLTAQAAARSGQDAAERITPHGVRLQTVIGDYRELEIYRAQYEGGDASAILRAFAFALSCSLPPPAWAVDAFLDRYKRHAEPQHGAPSLDDLFGAGKPNTAAKRAKQTQDWRIGCELWGGVVKALAAGRASSLTTALRQVLAARKWGIAETKARELVEAVERVQRPIYGGKALADYGRQVVSQKRPKARKA
jgi:hypothetical protein